MSKTAHSPSWLKFIKPQVDFFDLLNRQAKTTVAGATAFRDWVACGAKERCGSLHDAEHQADALKREIEKKLANTAVTPFDREEIYDISARLDLVLNGIKKTTKDIEFHKMHSDDDFVQRMNDRLVEGINLVAEAIACLESDTGKAKSAADQSRKTETAVAQVHREAMDVLYKQDDPFKLVKYKDLYDSLLLVASRVETVGEKLLHISIKAS
jgi:hypothetical protein